MKHQSPSQLANLSLCRRFTPDDVGSTAATAGTLFHADLESLVSEYFPSQWERRIASLDRSDDHREMLRTALEQVSPFLSMGLPVTKDARFMQDDRLETIEAGVYVECSVELWPDDPSHKTGRIDLLIVPAEGTAVVVDWKSSTQEADFSWQMGSYARALASLCSKPWTSIVCKIVAPNLELHEDVIYDAAAVADMERRILAVEEEAANPFTPPCPGQTQCKYCRCMRLRQCPAVATLAAKQLPAEYVSEASAVVDAPRILLSPKTLEERAHRRDWLSVMTMLADFIKEDDKYYFLVHTADSLPGYKVSTRLGNRQTDKTRLAEMNRRVMGAFGLSADELLAYVEPCKELLLDAQSVALGSRKSAEERYSEAVEPFTVRGPTIVTVRREAGRRIKKPKELADNEK